MLPYNLTLCPASTVLALMLSVALVVQVFTLTVVPVVVVNNASDKFTACTALPV